MQDFRKYYNYYNLTIDRLKEIQKEYNGSIVVIINGEYYNLINEEPKNIYTEVWKSAYDAYCWLSELEMWDVLTEHIENGDITQADADMMAKDIVEAYNSL